MKNNSKLILVVAVVVILAAVVWFAATRPPAEDPAVEDPVVEDPVAEDPAAEDPADEAPVQRTYTLFYGMTGRDPIQLSDTRIGQLIAEKTGVTLEIEYVVGGDAATRVGTMIASGDYPDIIFGHGEHNRFIEAGALVPIQDMIADKPNIQRTYGDILDMHRHAETGNIYFLSPYRGEPDLAHIGIGFWLVKELVRDLGFPTITNIDEYFDVIRDYVAQNPEFNGAPTIGFTFPAEGWRFFELTNPPNFLMGYPNDGDVQIARGDSPEDFSARTYATSDSAREYMLRLNQLWNEGLLDREVFVQTHDQWIEKVSSGRVVGLTAQRWQFGFAPMQALEDQGHSWRRFFPFQLLNEGVERGQYVGAAVPTIRDGMSISVAAEDPEGIIQFFDALLSDEIQKLIHWGVEGEDYNVGADGLFYRTQEQRDRRADPEYIRTQGTDWWGFPRTISPFADGNQIPGLTISEIKAGYDEVELEMLAGYGVETFAQLAPEPIPSPYGFGWDVALPDGSPAQLANARMGDLRRYHYPRMVMAATREEFDNEWNAFVAAWAESGYADYEAFMTQAIQERVRNWGLLD